MPADAIVGGTFTSVHNPMTTTVTQFLGVNNTGVAAGHWTDAAGNFHPFTFSGGTFTGINFAGKMSAQALGLNNDGEIVGSFMDAAGKTNGFLFNIATATYQQVDDPHAVGPGGTVINGLSDNGQIVGFFTDASGNVDGLVGTATTPEPASLLFRVSPVLGFGNTGFSLCLRNMAAAFRSGRFFFSSVGTAL